MYETPEAASTSEVGSKIPIACSFRQSISSVDLCLHSACFVTAVLSAVNIALHDDATRTCTSRSTRYPVIHDRPLGYAYRLVPSGAYQHPTGRTYATSLHRSHEHLSRQQQERSDKARWSCLRIQGPSCTHATTGQCILRGSYSFSPATSSRHSAESRSHDNESEAEP